MTGTAGFHNERGDLHRHAPGTLRLGEEGASHMTLGMADHPSSGLTATASMAVLHAPTRATPGLARGDVLLRVPATDPDSMRPRDAMPHDTPSVPPVTPPVAALATAAKRGSLIEPLGRDLTKTVSFLILHLLVGFTVAYIFTGSLAIASGIALVEPLVNAVVFFFHERAWNRTSRRKVALLDVLLHRHGTAERTAAGGKLQAEGRG